MKKQTFLLFILMAKIAISQDAIYNHGDLKMHGNVQVGFHEDFVNDGNFKNSAGLAGFYGDDRSLTISGSSVPIFYDTEIVVDRGLYLFTIIDIVNNNNMITGNLITPKGDKEIYVNFLDEAFYIGATDDSYIDGYSAIKNKGEFDFPVGDDDRIRTLSFSSSMVNPQAKCAYYFENPNLTSSFGKNFNTEKKESEFLKITSREYWHLEGAIPSKVTLTWDNKSRLSELIEFVEDIKIVGWEKENEMWVNLGNSKIEGNLYEGKVTSSTFIPSEFDIITLGGINNNSGEFTTLELDNYFVSPNGDGRNDYLVLEGVENAPNNEIQIFDRYGKLVYSKLNYNNEFNGISNRNFVISRDSGLPAGVYFYIITFWDLRQKHQGYLYLTSKE